MKTIPEEVYRDLAAQLKQAMPENGYFNGTFIYEDGECNCSLRCTVISGFIPVWYEFCADDWQYDNDFTWTKFKEYLG